MKMCRLVFLPLAIAGFAALITLAKAQSLIDSGNSSTPVWSVTTTPPPPDLTYMRPTQTTKLHNYLFDTIGPYPIVGAGVVAGINRSIIRRRSGDKERRVMASASRPASASQR